jgi:5-bromo-4-chloroindolyl phosphate hydrolysis protein
MKKVLMQIKEFLQFRQVAEMYRIKFTYGYSKEGITIIANELQLNEIGY